MLRVGAKHCKQSSGSAGTTVTAAASQPSCPPCSLHAALMERSSVLPVYAQSGPLGTGSVIRGRGAPSPYANKGFVQVRSYRLRDHRHHARMSSRVCFNVKRKPTVCSHACCDMHAAQPTGRVHAPVAAQPPSGATQQALQAPHAPPHRGAPLPLTVHSAIGSLATPPATPHGAYHVQLQLMHYRFPPPCAASKRTECSTCIAARHGQQQVPVCYSWARAHHHVCSPRPPRIYTHAVMLLVIPVVQSMQQNGGTTLSSPWARQPAGPSCVSLSVFLLHRPRDHALTRTDSSGRQRPRAQTPSRALPPGAR